MAIKYYRLKEGSKCDVLAECKDSIPLDKFTEISEQEYLTDRSGKAICYGHGIEVTDKVKAKFGWDK